MVPNTCKKTQILFSLLHTRSTVQQPQHSLKLPQTRQLIPDHLCSNTEKYLTFYMNTSHDELITSSDLLLEEIICFFDNGNFNTSVVDLLVQISADALSLEIFIL